MVAYIKNSKKLFQPKNVEVVGCQLFTSKMVQYLFNLIDLKAKRYCTKIVVTPMIIKHLH